MSNNERRPAETLYFHNSRIAMDYGHWENVSCRIRKREVRYSWTHFATSQLLLNISFFYFREEWVVAIQSVANKLAECEDVEMKGASVSTSSTCSDNNYQANVDDFSAKFSLQGTSSSKTSGKRKVVRKRCLIFVSFPMLTLSHVSLVRPRRWRILSFWKYSAKAHLAR